MAFYSLIYRNLSSLIQIESENFSMKLLINIHSFCDLITNSSSEVFVAETKKTKSVVIDILKSQNIKFSNVYYCGVDINTLEFPDIDKLLIYCDGVFYGFDSYMKEKNLKQINFRKSVEYKTYCSIGDNSFAENNMYDPVPNLVAELNEFSFKYYERKFNKRTNADKIREEIYLEYIKWACAKFGYDANEVIEVIAYKKEKERLEELSWDEYDFQIHEDGLNALYAKYPHIEEFFYIINTINGNMEGKINKGSVIIDVGSNELGSAYDKVNKIFPIIKVITS